MYVSVPYAVSIVAARSATRATIVYAPGVRVADSAPSRPINCIICSRHIVDCVGYACGQDGHSPNILNWRDCHCERVRGASDSVGG